MATAHDVAKYLLSKLGRMSTMRLQKLLYYCQAWSLVWDDRAMFSNRIEAWANGPVIPEIFEEHRGEFSVGSWKRGSVTHLDQEAKDTVDAVIRHYGKYNGQQLSDLTHRSKPWKDARRGLSDGERGSSIISLQSMQDYYASL